MPIDNQQQRGHWSSRMAFIWAAAGAAVGLGNIWKFPYMAGANGGSAFVLVYLLSVVIIAIPALMAEILIGRLGQQNAVSSLCSLADKAGASRHWQLVGWMGAFTLLLIFSFYTVFSGIALAYVVQAFQGVFQGMDAGQVGAVFGGFMSNPGKLLVWHTLFMVLTIAVILKGVQGGLEKANRIMMPALLVILILLVGYGVSTSGFKDAVAFLFHVDFSQINGAVVIAAVGQAFFSLALGAGAMVVYGSYLSTRTRLGNTVLTIASLDVIVALLAGLAIFPLVFAFGLAPEAGPGLLFQALPIAFGQMPGGAIWGGLFFLFLVFAAWTSAVSFPEPIVSLLKERHHMSRTQAALLVGFIAWLLGIVTILSFSSWSDITLFGLGIFDFIDVLTSDILLPLGGLLFTVFAGWVIQREAARDELQLSSETLYQLWRLAVRLLIPVAIVLIMVNAFVG